MPLNGHNMSRWITNRLEEDIYQVNILHSKGIILSTQLPFKDQQHQKLQVLILEFKQLYQRPLHSVK